MSRQGIDRVLTFLSTLFLAGYLGVMGAESDAWRGFIVLGILWTMFARLIFDFDEYRRRKRR